jgi:hypothetical protein
MTIKSSDNLKRSEVTFRNGNQTKCLSLLQQIEEQSEASQLVSVLVVLIFAVLQPKAIPL